MNVLKRSSTRSCYTFYLIYFPALNKDMVISLTLHVQCQKCFWAHSATQCSRTESPPK